MRVVIYGSGAVGCYFGARLAEAGEDVVFIARGRTLEALRKDGIRLQSDLGDLHVPEVQVTDDPASVGTADVVIVGVKTWQVAAVGEAMKPMVGDETMVLPLQNGVEASSILSNLLGAEHVLGGTVWIIAEANEPGRITHSGKEPRVVLGELDGRQTDRVAGLAEALRRARARSVVPDDVKVAIWEKFLFISVVSGMGAVTRMPVGVWRSTAETRELAAEAGAEIAAVAKGHGVTLPDDAVPRALGIVDMMPKDATASMQRDIMAGLPSELEEQTGAVVRLGRNAGVSTPVNRVFHTVLLPQESAARSR